MHDNIGIIGYGFVGKATHLTLPRAHYYLNDDEALKEASTPVRELVDRCGFIFVCVPTPANKHDGSLRTDIVDSVLKDLHMELAKKGRLGNVVVCIRSTILPGQLDYWTQFSGMRLAVWPEFLREKHWMDDVNKNREYIFGGRTEDTNQLTGLIRRANDNPADFYPMTLDGACMVKYMRNTFLAVKVAFMNEWYNYFQDVGTGVWDDVASVFGQSENIGHGHTQVPGPDGKFGFGGKCLPKDLSAVIQDCEQRGMDIPRVLQAAQDRNKLLRPEEY